MSYTIVGTKTSTELIIEPPILVVDKSVEMGATDVRAQYEVTAAFVTIEKGDEDYLDVTLKGYRLTKAGKRRTNARFDVIPTCYVTTRHPDGNMTFDSDAFDTVKQDAILAASGVDPEDNPEAG